MQIFKRTLSALLAVVMIVALFPAVVFADAVTLEEFAQSQWLETVDFSTFAGAKVTGSDLFQYEASEDGKALHVYGTENSVSGTVWGGNIGDYTADATTYYTMTYKVWMNPDVTAKDTAAGNGVYVGVGGVPFGSRYITFSTNTTHSNGAFRCTSSSYTGRTSGSAVPASDAGYDTQTIDGNAYYTIRLTYDGPNKKATAYILKAGQSGVHADDWTQWQQVSYTPGSGALKFNLTLYDLNLDCIVRDVNYYTGDIVKTANFTTETQEATCTEPGAVITSCDCGCGETTTETIDATGVHIYGEDDKCTMCGQDNPNAGCDHSYFSDCDTICEKCGEITRPDAGHTVEHVEAKEATCYELGNIEYWFCSVCGQAWLDAECTQNTNAMAVKLPMLEAVASVGDVNYGSLDAAIAAATEEDSVKILKGLTLTSTVEISKNVTITADEAVTITMADDFSGDMVNITGGKLILTGASEEAKITLAAGVQTVSIVAANGGEAELTNVILAGNEATTAANNSAHGFNVNTENVTFTLKNVDILNMVHGDGIRAPQNTQVVNLDNVTIDNVGRYGLYAGAAVYIYNTQNADKALIISNTYDHCIDVKDGGKVISALENVAEGTYPIQLDTTTKTSGVGIIVRKGEINLTNISVANTASYGIWVQQAVAVATVKNATISAGATAFETVADSSLTVENVKVENCGDDAVNILGNLTGEITFAEHDYVAGETVAPTCFVDGYTPYTCSVCGDSYNGDVVAAAGEHSYDDGVVTEEPTCVKEGVLTVTCSACGDAYTEAIDATGEHSYGEDDKCTVCGKENPDTCEHSYFSDCDSVCEICGEVTRPEAGHKVEHVEAKAAACYEDGNIEYWYCTVCGAAWLDAE